MTAASAMPPTALLASVHARVLDASAPGALRGAEAPATPDADEARRAAERELARSEYQDSLWTRFWRWLWDRLDPSGAVAGVPGWLSILVAVLLALGLVTVLGILLTRVTRVRRARTDSALFVDDDRDSAALTLAANSAAARGDWAVAVVERFRAIIRSLDERGLIEDYPGMTAHEAASTAAAVMADQVENLLQAGALFDAVRYGEVVSTPEQDAWMRDLADVIGHARPTQPEPATAVVPQEARA